MVRDGVGALMAAIELVEDRYIDYPNFPTPILIADDFFNTGVILGEELSYPTGNPFHSVKLRVGCKLMVKKLDLE